MEEYFEREITAIERELRWLKTSVVKSGATITSMVKSLPYSTSLRLGSSTNAVGETNFRVTTKDNAIFNATLDLYLDNIAVGPRGDTRRRAIEAYCISSGTYVVHIITHGDSNDISTLQSGGEVVINGTLTITCTDDFELEAV